MDVAMQLHVEIANIFKNSHSFWKEFSCPQAPTFILSLTYTHSQKKHHGTVCIWPPKTKLLPTPLYSAPSKTNYYVPTPMN